MTSKHAYIEQAPQCRKALLARQYEQIENGQFINCNCGAKFHAKYMYKCLYCGIWYCFDCAEEHFGETFSSYHEKKNGLNFIWTTKDFNGVNEEGKAFPSRGYELLAKCLGWERGYQSFVFKVSKNNGKITLFTSRICERMKDAKLAAEQYYFSKLSK